MMWIPGLLDLGGYFKENALKEVVDSAGFSP